MIRADLSAGSAADERLRPGDSVIVRTVPSDGIIRRHVRTPWYVRGRHGRVIAGRGCWPRPEILAEGVSDPTCSHLYAVEFDQRELWPGYRGGSDDRVVLDLSGHWLRRWPEPSSSKVKP